MTPEEAKHLATTLRTTREQRGLSENEVARRAGVNVGTVSRIEQGQIASPRPENLLAIAAALDIPASDIFATANWVQPDDLPSFTPYMRAKYGSMPDDALRELQRHFHEMAIRYGAAGPRPGEDEY